MINFDDAISIEEGVSSSFVLDMNGMQVFYKTREKIVKKKIRKLDTLIKNILHHRIVLKKYVNLNQGRKALIEKEVKTWQLWKEKGIYVADLIDYIDKEIIFEYIPNSILFNRLLSNQFSMSKFEKFLEVYDQIRKVANKDKNLFLLHSDPHLGNFLYDPTKSKAIPIDSGIILNKRMSFSELDITLVARTLQSISELSTNTEHITKYVQKFKEILSNYDIESLLSLNFEIPQFIKTCYAIREEIASRIKNRDKINRLYNLEQFSNKYNSLIRPILEC